MKYILQEKYGSEYNAGSKARNDAEAIAIKNGYCPLAIQYQNYDSSKSFFSRIGKNLTCITGWFRLLKLLKSGDTLLIQHPMQSGAFAGKLMLPRILSRGVKVVAVIHDLATLRKMGEDNKTANIHDFDILQRYHKIISHNAKMTRILIDKYKIPAEHIINLEIFDYLCKENTQKRENDSSVIVAGNLSFEKSPYIEKLIKGFLGTIHLYGVGLDQKQCTSRVNYHGVFPPEKLPEVLEGAFGIVWDGTSISTCAGNTGTYLKFNNPHKTSLYLVAGIPVIIWSKAAMADFVKANRVGIVVDSLEHLEDILKKIDEEEYHSMCANAQKISEQLRKGKYLSKALAKCDRS